MIQSRWRFLGRQKIFIQLFFFAIVLALFADEIAGSFFGTGIIHRFTGGINRGWSLAFIFLAFILWLFNIAAIGRFINIISIDAGNRTISFKNIFTRRVRTYSFTYFDGYRSTSRTAGGYRYRELFLMKNNRSVRKISEYYYSNFDSLSEGIGNLYYIGPFKHSPQTEVRMFFNRGF